MADLLFVLAAVQVPSFLTEVVVLVVASAVIAYVCARIGVMPIVGFLIAGVVIGPNALGLVRDSDLIETVAEIGVILLLFTLGIEFSLERLGQIRRTVFVGGGLQMGLTMAATVGLLLLFGIDWRTGLFTGSLVALSSTAIVMKVLGNERDTTSPRGQLALGILIFQDLAIVALVLIVPMLAGNGGSAGAIGRGVGTALVIVAVVIVAARRVMPAILERVGGTCAPEVFLLTVIAICMGTAWATSLAGVSLSLGAFLAGLVVSESRFSHHAFSEILPLQILFSAVFFVSIGLLLDLQFVLSNPLLILAVVAAVIVLKVILSTVSGLILGYGLGTAAGAALLIGQIGEFSFVLERVGNASGLHPAGYAAAGGQTFIAATVLLMGITPLLARAGRALEKRFSDQAMAEEATLPVSAERVELENHVIVAGYGSAARYLTRVLRDSGVPFVILTLSPSGATEAERDGLRVLLGDYSRRTMLDLAAIDRAKMLVIPDDAADMARRVASIARSINPTLQIVVRTHSTPEVESLLEAGSDEVFVDEMEIGIQLFTRVLFDYQVPVEEVEDHVETVRAGGYAALRSGISETLVVCATLDETCFDTRAFTVREGSPAVGMTQREFADRSGIRVSTVVREGAQIDLRDDLLLASGDRVTARASAAEFSRAADLLRRGTAAAPPAAAARVVTLDSKQQNAPGCQHVELVEPEITTTAEGCQDCMPTGDRWVHLRICMTCGGVRCCDSSKNKHATAHFNQLGHPIIKSYQSGETWAWCYVDKVMF